MKILSRLFESKKYNIENNRADDVNQNSSNSSYVNNFSSETNYLIWVNLKSFKVNIFQGSKNNWNLIHSYICTIGNACPTE